MRTFSILFLFSFLFVSSCKKPVVPIFFAEKHWKLTTLTIDPEVVIGGQTTAILWDLVMADCNIDDTFFFSKNHEILIYDNDIQCTTETYTIKGTWAYGETDLKIDIYVDENLSYTCDIITLTDTEMVLHVPGIAYGFPANFLVEEKYSTIP